MTYIISLDAIPPGERQLVGGKAAGCATLHRMGLPVPNGFALTGCAFNSFLSTTGLEQGYQELLAQFLTDCSEESLKQQCEAFQAKVLEQSIPAPIQRDLDAQLAKHSGLVSVRSSANIEDAPNSAFAGVYHSELNVALEDVSKAIIKCWSYGFSYDAITHAMRNGIDPKRCQLSLFIQEMVEADFAGVIFTQEPSGQKVDKGALAFVKGLGDSLMDGESMGYSATVDRESGSVSGDFADSGISQALLRHLVDEAKKIEAEQGHPQDIEWAIKNEKLYFLQTRNITTIEPKREQSITWTRELSEERFPGPISPLGWSVMQDVLATNVQTLADRFGLVAKHPNDVARTIDNYIYSNQQFFAIPGSMKVEVGKQLRYAPLYFKEFMGSIRYMPNAMRNEDGFGMSWLMLTRFFKAFIFPHANEVLASWDGHLAQVLKKLEALREIDATQLSDDGLIGYKELFDEVADEYMEPDLAVFVVKTACQWLMNKLGAQLWGDNADEFITALTSGVVDNITLRRNAELEDIYLSFADDKALVALLKDSKFDEFMEQLSGEPRKALEGFIHRCGHVTANWDIKEPTWGENPNTILALMRSFTLVSGIRSARDNEVDRSKQFEESKQKVHAALAHTPWMKEFFDELLSMLHEFMRIDEEHNFHCSRMYVPLRKLYLETGKRFVERRVLAKKEDVFFLTVPEITGILSEGESFPLRYAVDNRVASFKRAEKVRPADKYLDQTPLVDQNLQAVKEGNTIRGEAASPGQFSGKVKIVETPEDFATFQEGEILVTTSPKPAWTPLYSVAGGLVAATGSMLSHGLISAREYGLPAVIGIANVINELENGQEITVDGTTGVVILES